MTSSQLARIPALVYSRHRLLAAVPFLLLTLLAAITIPRLVVSDHIEVQLPEGDAYDRMERSIHARFAPSEFIILALEADGPRPEEAARAAVRLARRIQELPGVASVVSFSTVKDVRLEGEELRFVPLLDPAGLEVSAESLKRRIRAHPLHARFLLSRDGSAFNLYVFPSPRADGHALVERVLAYAGEESSVPIHAYGLPVLRHALGRNVIRELRVLGLAALVVVFLVEVWITRSLLFGFILWLFSLLPAGWVLGLFPLFGLELEVVNLFVPIIILALATSYGIHLFRYFILDPNLQMADTLEKVSPTIASASFTTVVGFCSQLVSPVAVLRTLGLMVILGIVLATAASVFFLPLLVDRAARLRPVPALKADSTMPLPSLPGAPIYLAAALALLCAGLPWVRHDNRISLFKPGTPISRTMEYFQRHNGGIDELEVVLDTGREYGLVDPGLFRRIKAFGEALKGQPHVSQAIVFTDFVEWVNGRMAGAGGPLEPRTEREIGESLELLAAGDTGLGIERLVDPSWSGSRVLLRYGISALSAGQAAERVEAIRAAVQAARDAFLPELEVKVLGLPLRNERRIRYLTGGLLSGTLLYLAVLFLFLLFLLRSPRWVLIAMVPTVSSMLFYLGIMGWLRIPLGYTTALTTSIVLGTSVEDVLYFVLFYRQQAARLGHEQAMALTGRKAGIATVQTTLIIVIGLAVLLISSVTSITQSGILTGLSLSFGTLVTLLVVPPLIARFPLPAAGSTRGGGP